MRSHTVAIRPLSVRTTALVGLSLFAASCNTATKNAEPAAPMQPKVATPYAGEVGMGVSYLQTRAADLVEATADLLTTIQNRDLSAAKSAYFEARAPYEEIQVMAAAFPELDRAIDARSSSFQAGELDPEFRGFHRIEVFLFSRENIGACLPYAEQLLEDVETLETLFTERGRFDAELSFESMINRCAEIASKTITSEEEMWSNQSLLVVRHAWVGIHSQYRFFGADVRKVDVKLAERIDRAYRKAMELIATDFRIGNVEGSPYSIIDRDDRRAIADASLKLRGYLIQAQTVLGLVDA